MEFKDYYAILEIDRLASSEEIRTAYWFLSKKWHPDHNPGRNVNRPQLESYYIPVGGIKLTINDHIGSFMLVSQMIVLRQVKTSTCPCDRHSGIIIAYLRHADNVTPYKPGI